ncbi:MAG: ribonuclease HIII [Bacteroidetes bacterium]|nr:ribonuclease HIII [Bacteroidota bacterium]
MSIQTDAHDKIEEIRVTLSKNNFSVSPISGRQYNYEVVVTDYSDSLKVQVYFGKKGVKTILQGNSDTEFYHQINNLISDQPMLAFQNPEQDEPEEYIGTDESGKGDYFGPLVIAGVYTDKKSRSKLTQIGVRDSKELSDPQIGKIAKKILDVVGENHHIINIPPEKYNALYESYKNLNKLLSWGHSEIIEKLVDLTRTNNVIVDKFSKTSLDISAKKGFADLNIFLTPKAERFTAVAAASILARDSFNRWFEKKEIEGLPLLKGASTEVENLAKKLVQINGPEILQEIAKLHFKTTQKISNK